MFLSELLTPPAPTPFYVVSTLGRTPCGTNVVEAMDVAELQVDGNVRQATVYQEGVKEPVARYVWDLDQHRVREDFAPRSHFDLGPTDPDEDGLDDDWFEDDLPDDEGESPYDPGDIDFDG